MRKEAILILAIGAGLAYWLLKPKRKGVTSVEEIYPGLPPIKLDDKNASINVKPSDWGVNMWGEPLVAEVTDKASSVYTNLSKKVTSIGSRISNWIIPAAGKKYEPLFTAAEKAHGIPPKLIARQAYQESTYRPDVVDGSTVSSGGAVGIMQIIPKYHPGVDPADPKSAINYGASYLRQMYNKYGSWKKALAAYNMGPNAFDKVLAKHGEGWLKPGVLNAETYNYVTQITRDVPVA